MSIKLNNVAFNDGGTAKFNNTALSAIKYGSTQVWQAKSPAPNVNNNAFIFNNASNYTDISGGLVYGKRTQVNWYFFGGLNPVRFCNTNHYPLYQGWVSTQNKVYISGWSKLVLRFRGNMGYGDAGKGGGLIMVGLFPDAYNTIDQTGDNNPFETTKYIKRNWIWMENTDGDVDKWLTCDITNVKGSYNVIAGYQNDQNYHTYDAKLYAVYFE